MSKSLVARITLAFVLCVFATVIIRNGALGLSAVGERIAIALVWIVGVAWMLWMSAKSSN